MNLDMYLDPDYSKLIIEVNKLKIEIAEKISEKDWLSIYVLPEIKNSYNLKLGMAESALFSAKLNLDKLKRKIFLYDEAIKYDKIVSENDIDKIIEKEFKKENREYNLMKKDIKLAIEFTSKEKISNDVIENLNILYKNLLIILSPIINLKNTRLENQLYDILEDSYKSGDINKMIALKLLCDENNIKADIEIDNLEQLLELKKLYEKVLEENRDIVFNIRSSEMFSNRTLLKSEILLRRKKDDINCKIDEISKEYEKQLKILEKLKKKK